MTDKEEPIYCPLCGNEHAAADYSDLFGWGVYCGFCNCNIHGYETREGAVRQWNHRFTPDNGGGEK